MSRLPRAFACLLAVLACAVCAVCAPAADAAGRCGAHPWCDTALTPETRASLLLEALTRQEKIGLLAGDELFGVAGTADRHTGTEDGVARVGLPPTYYSDGPVGPRQGKATSLPSPMSVAASFDPSVAERHGAVVGDEAKKKGNDVVFAPTVNIMRTPLGGRTFESFGEETLLHQRLGVAWLKGLQAQGVIGNVKHFAINNQEGAGLPVPGVPIGVGQGNRMTVNAVVDERTMREVYLPHFEAAVKEAGVGSVMCSYNKVNGQYACESRELLSEILRRDWGFTGYVLADYGASHGPASSLNNGLDFEPWPGIAYGPAPVNALLVSGQVGESTLDARVRNILRTQFAGGFFDRHAYRNDDGQIDKAAHARAAADLETAGITLLENDGGVLPLDAGALSSLAVIGADADAFKSGGGSSNVSPFASTTPRQGIAARLGAGKVRYDSGDDPAVAAAVAKASDAAVVVVADVSSEGADRPCLGLNCGASDRRDRDALIEAVAAANPRTIVVLETGGPVLTPWRDKVRGLVEAWYPGQEGGASIASVLFGDADPGGRLPVTFPKSEADLPTAGDPEKYPGTNETVRYKEGVLVGYRWFDAKGIEPAFAFGHGLSYTTFAYRDLRVAPGRDGAVAEASVEVVNTGARTGFAVPQLYLSKPSPRAGVVQPPRQLEAFAKVSLSPGEARRVPLALSERAFSYWDAREHAWRVTPGCYGVRVGASSRDLPLSGVIARGGANCPGALLALDGPSASERCVAATALRGVAVRAARRGRVRIVVPRGTRVSVDVFRHTAGRRVLGERRVARLGSRRGSFTWDARGRRVRDGIYSVRVRAGSASRRFALVRGRGGWRVLGPFERQASCGVLARFKAERPAFGGRSNRAGQIAYRLRAPARVTVMVRRGGKVVRRFGPRDDAAGRTYRLRIAAEKLRRGTYTITLHAVPPAGKAVTATLGVRRL